MTPNANQHNPDPYYLRGLVRASGLSQRAVAERIGVSVRMMRYYLAHGDKNRPAPYVVQYAMEHL